MTLRASLLSLTQVQTPSPESRIRAVVAVDRRWPHDRCATTDPHQLRPRSLLDRSPLSRILPTSSKAGLDNDLVLSSHLPSALSLSKDAGSAVSTTHINHLDRSKLSEASWTAARKQTSIFYLTN